MSQDRSRLTDLLGRGGYHWDMIAYEVTPPGLSSANARLDVVAFTRPAPHDLRTSAIVGEVQSIEDDPGWTLNLCRAMAAPFLLRGTSGPIDLYQVGRVPAEDRRVHSFEADDPGDASVLRSINPMMLHQAKTGARQLTLFPIDVRLLDNARHRSVGSLQARLEAAFAHALDRGVPAAAAAELVISALSCVVVQHKSSATGTGPAAMAASALQHHKDYFEVLAGWEASDQPLVDEILTELGRSVDYSAIDARTLNSIYERLFLTKELRKELGIFYTPFEFANRMLEAIPIEELAPEERCVYDPACGSGNLLLAAQERLETLAPASWAPAATHSWLKTHLAGSDIDPMAVLLAKHSLLVSALPMGNTWKVAKRDFLSAAPAPTPRPNLVVSNPPWQSLKGSRSEKATKFLRGAVDLLVDGGFLACILPVSWLTAERDRSSRLLLSETCEVFEVWRLPRDVFPGARVGCSVVFAQKGSASSKRRPAFRWINAGAANRSAFLEHGRTSFRTLLPGSAPGGPLSAGPVDELLGAGDQLKPLGSLVESASGVVQSGTLVPSPSRGDMSIPVLGRGARPPTYRLLDDESITWVDTPDQLLGGLAARDVLRAAPKVLVQADRFADNPWRVRPVVDTVGVVPVGLWHALFPADLQTAFALNAVLASSVASLWVHSRVSPKRIPLEVLLRLPLPARFGRQKRRLALMGEQLATAGPSAELLRDLESTMDSLYGLSDEAAGARDEIMSGFKAPDGSVRIAAAGASGPALGPGSTDAPRSGAVLRVEGSLLRIWTVDSPDEDGTLSAFPTRMPGWMAAAGSTFDLRGDIGTGVYTFHRSAHLPDLQGDTGDASSLV